MAQIYGLGIVKGKWETANRHYVNAWFAIRQKVEETRAQTVYLCQIRPT
ncbi:UNVERIFIED_ORG: hypothetical protein QOE_4565 [Clostridioides difficile F501]